MWLPLSLFVPLQSWLKVKMQQSNLVVDSILQLTGSVYGDEKSGELLGNVPR